MGAIFTYVRLAHLQDFIAPSCFLGRIIGRSIVSAIRRHTIYLAAKVEPLPIGLNL